MGEGCVQAIEGSTSFSRTWPCSDNLLFSPPSLGASHIGLAHGDHQSCSSRCSLCFQMPSRLTSFGSFLNVPSQSGFPFPCLVYGLPISVSHLCFYFSPQQLSLSNILCIFDICILFIVLFSSLKYKTNKQRQRCLSLWHLLEWIILGGSLEWWWPQYVL